MSTVALSLLLVILGQLLNAVIVLIDKYIVTKTSISRPVVYAFYVALISGVVVVLLPFGVIHIPDAYTLLLSILIGITFVLSITLLYSALKIAAATDVVPWLAAIATIATFLLSSVFLNERLPTNFLPALTLVVIGMLLVGHFRFNKKSFTFTAISGILFGLSAILLKKLFGYAPFFDGFFWSRMGNVFSALLLLAIPSIRNDIFHGLKLVSHKTSLLVILNRVLGGLAFLFIIIAIQLGSVSVVNALSSLQFLFVFVLIFVFKKYLREQYEHEFRPGHVLHKIASMVFIIVGFFVLFI